MNRLALVGLLLAGCGSSPPVPLPPAPASMGPRPPTLALEADWSTPSIGLGLACTEDVPPICEGAAPWLTFDRPGTQGQACVDPGPNTCYAAAAGSLEVDGHEPGWPLISRATFPAAGAISIETVISAECTGPGCFIGPVLYNGERNYRALYLAWASKGVQAWMYGPTVAVPLSAAVYPARSPHVFRIDYQAGTWRYYVDGALLLAEAPGAISGDPTILTQDPHLALFMGSARGSFGRVDVRTD